MLSEIKGSLMHDLLKKYRAEDEYRFEAEGCFITEVSNSAADTEVSIVRARVTPGATTAWHVLANTTERYVVLAGRGIAELGGKSPAELNVGDVLIIPPDCPQRIRNVTDEDLIFLAICSPAFKSSNYRAWQED